MLLRYCSPVKSGGIGNWDTWALAGMAALTIRSNKELERRRQFVVQRSHPPGERQAVASETRWP